MSWVLQQLHETAIIVIHTSAPPAVVSTFQQQMPVKSCVITHKHPRSQYITKRYALYVLV